MAPEQLGFNYPKKEDEEQPKPAAEVPAAPAAVISEKIEAERKEKTPEELIKKFIKDYEFDIKRMVEKDKNKELDVWAIDTLIQDYINEANTEEDKKALNEKLDAIKQLFYEILHEKEYRLSETVRSLMKGRDSGQMEKAKLLRLLQEKIPVAVAKPEEAKKPKPPKKKKAVKLKEEARPAEKPEEELDIWEKHAEAKKKRDAEGGIGKSLPDRDF